MAFRKDVRHASPEASVIEAESSRLPSGVQARSGADAAGWSFGQFDRGSVGTLRRESAVSLETAADGCQRPGGERPGGAGPRTRDRIASRRAGARRVKKSVGYF